MIGLGYIGLPTAVMFANSGNEVVGVDVEPDVVKLTNEGKTNIKEKNFSELLEKAVSSGNLRAQSQMCSADVFIICVPTPFCKSDEPVTLEHVKSAAESIIPHLKPGNLIILESTVPPGTTSGPLKEVLERGGLKAGLDFELAYCPERLLPGNLVYEIVHNDRIVGGVGQTSSDKAKSLYAQFVKGEIILTDATTAEFVKVAENTYGAVNVALVNELAVICERLGINVREALELANRHPRVRYMDPGPGVGGHCVPVDPWFIVRASPDEADLIKTALQKNESMPDHVLSLLAGALEEVGTSLQNAKIVVLGIAYKKNVNDIRESPALALIEKLEERGVDVIVCDPMVDDFRLPVEKDVMLAVEGADAMVLITDHDEFRNLGLVGIREKMRNPVFVDTRNVYQNADGFIFRQLGVG